MTFTDADRDLARRAADGEPVPARLLEVYVGVVFVALILGLMLGLTLCDA